MKNYGLMRFKTVTPENFTSNFGIQIRRLINPVLRPVFKTVTKGLKNNV